MMMVIHTSCTQHNIYVDGEGGKLLAQRNVFVEKSVQIFEVSSFSQRHSLFVTVHTLLFTYINLIEERLIFYFSIHVVGGFFTFFDSVNVSSIMTIGFYK